MRSVNDDAGTSSFQELKRLVEDGVYTDIYLAFESHGIFKAIGERATDADSSTYQPMLLALQSYATAIFILAVTALHERQGNKYELHSVHGTLQHLRDNAADIAITQPVFVQQSMERLGAWSSVPHDAGVAQTRAVVDVLMNRLAHHTNSPALKALKDQRDRRIAHPERVDANALGTTTWDEALKLLDIPIEALAVCGGFTNYAYVDSRGKVMMDIDAARAGVATRRILDLPRPAR